MRFPMSYYRGTVLPLLACAVLFPFSYARSASGSPQLAPAGVPGSTQGLVASSAEYPNTTEGLRSLMNDMLAATKRGDRQKLDALMKHTEFADYARYFVT